MSKLCFYCEDTGFIKGKEIRPQDKLPEQICPYCEIGQAVYRGYRKAEETQINNYEALKASHEKLITKIIELQIKYGQSVSIVRNEAAKELEQALQEAGEL